MKILIKFFVLLLLVSLSACSDLTSINENPNNVSETHPQLLLTQIAHSAFSVQGRSAMYASRMIVQTDGENAEQYYRWNRGSFGDYNRLRDVTKMMEEANRIDNDVYRAIAKFFRAHYFYELTLTFGDIPYSEALQGELTELYNPKYDTQKEVFKGILNELAEANTLLESNNDLIAGDIIYGGNPAKWRKLVNSFRLKVLISLSKKESDTDLNVKSAFASIYNNQPIFESNADNGQLVFVDQDGSRYNEFNSSSYGSGLYMDSTFVKRLQDRKDPRLFIFCSQTRNAKEGGLAESDFDAYEGGDPLAPYAEVNDKAAQGDASKVNLRYTTDPTTEPHNLLSYAELEFILAEAALRGWIAADAKMLYENGVKASFEFYNMHAKGYEGYVTQAAADTYLMENLVDLDNALTTEAKLERVMTQKYFTAFLQSGWRMYFDQLRTGYPYFEHNAGETPPTRWIYPESEYLQNSENVSAAITSQFGSGNDKIREIPWWLQ
ncbi:SusD/RagB family nutrient-binding outer membrane lipoprotein [Snuella sedimenti]|uniref:SusD/RagB family nutrient-binding outer membrane lipoprotein n=1 Tax=Snuella sedimenti TaxID=2798802 RepID=A0A8J7IX87_9FLAO|nr:SusD/RagB family nutrient-binding outer membrane lipoprotein [Snuella sedimenti]MBJ6368875.1 SusD/RagB family nutrient-binding outer membrane lipoprotein [Snuella sedimenti]